MIMQEGHAGRSCRKDPNFMDIQPHLLLIFRITMLKWGNLLPGRQRISEMWREKGTKTWPAEQVSIS